MTNLPGSVLFACTTNSVRSPMAESFLKMLHGSRIYVDSAGVRRREIDGFAIAAMDELGIDLSHHHAKTFDDLDDGSEELGDRPVGAGVDLALQVVEVGRGRCRPGVHLGVRGDRDLEVVAVGAGPDGGDEVGCGLVATADRRVTVGRLAVGRGIAPQGDDVVDACGDVAVDHRLDLVLLAPTVVRWPATGTGSVRFSSATARSVRCWLVPPAP